MIEQIRLYRNSVAHFKFFYKTEYDECNKLVTQLNKAITKAIQLTEKKDFVCKNLEAFEAVFISLKNIFNEVAPIITSTLASIKDTFSNVISPVADILKSWYINDINNSN